MKLSSCPALAVLERLSLGELLEAEAGAVEDHLLHCDACLRRLKGLSPAQDSLATVLRGETRADVDPLVVALMTRLKSWPANQGASMLALSCAACSKKLSVKQELAGKKVKCPACGGVVAVPATVPAGLAADATLPPSPPAASRSGTHPPSSAADATQVGPTLDADHGLTDFLAPAQAADELGRLGKYRVLKVLGHGGMGVVYKAKDTKRKRTVALKAMLPTLAASASAGKRFLRKAESMAAVEHDHIVRIYQIDEDRGVPYLAMEFLKGEPLDERLNRDGQLPVSEAVRVSREMAEGLAAAHATGLIHRDIKPGNVWLEAPKGRVKILDFGLARAASQDEHLTQQGAIVGTPAYMAPEQARGETVDARCDLFSLGVVMYRLLSGQQPFRGSDTVSTLMEVALTNPPAPATLNAKVPADLSAVVMKLLEKDPAKRPASAEEVVRELLAIEKRLAVKEDRTETAPVAPPSVPPAAPKRSRVPLLVAVAVALIGLAGVGLWATGLIRFQTEHGDFVIATDDPDFSFSVAKNGVTLEDRKKQRKYNLNVVRQGNDQYELEATDADADLSFKSKTFTIKRGETIALKAWFERKGAVAVQPLDDAWLKEVAALPTDKQVEAVAAKLKERNPDFDGKVTHQIVGGKVTYLEFVTDHVKDISPLRALKDLPKLACNGSRPRQGRLADLSPLKEMKVTWLQCTNNPISDLSPLRDLPLDELNCNNTNVSNLLPVQIMPLNLLYVSNTHVSDLTPRT